MRWAMGRLSLLALGAILVTYGIQMLHRGIFVYQNAWYRGTVYSAGIVATGVFVGLLAFLPPATWVDRWTARKKKHQQPDHPAYHQRHHGSKEHSPKSDS
jgi:hypothetical protein